MLVTETERQELRRKEGSQDHVPGNPWEEDVVRREWSVEPSVDETSKKGRIKIFPFYFMTWRL